MTKSIDAFLHVPFDKDNIVEFLHDIGSVLDSLGSVIIQYGVPQGLGIVVFQVIDKKRRVLLAQVEPDVCVELHQTFIVFRTRIEVGSMLLDLFSEPLVGKGIENVVVLHPKVGFV